MPLPVVAAGTIPAWLWGAAGGYLYGVFSEDGITTRKVVIGALGAAASYYIIKKANK